MQTVKFAHCRKIFSSLGEPVGGCFAEIHAEKV
jgi:hypothetical protein